MAAADSDTWHPLCFDRTVAHDRDDMDELIARGEAAFIHDTIDSQLADLVRTRNPRQMLSEDELAARVAEMTNASAHDYGRWVFFPWSRRLVHVLPPTDFFELRTDRNRNKITRQEQQKLARLRVGIAGLSVGNAVALTIALEGLCGELRMADFDRLDLSNMNRIRCGVHQLGLHKAVISARQIFEQNPYADLTLYTDGVTPENLGAFFEDEGRKLDLVIDECDSMYIKLKLREEARARRMPLIMETSDRGMLDVERYDLEPKRPILHGLLGDMTADTVASLPPQARLGLILRIIGESTMSARLAASMLEFGQTLRGLSQLGSDVVLGGATSAIAVRRFGLGMPLPSGRVFIDVNRILSEIQPPPIAPEDDSDVLAMRQRQLIDTVVEAALLAPSAGNMQPWRFVIRGGDLEVWHDVNRSGGADHKIGRNNAHLAIGAALENLQLAAGGAGYDAEMSLFPAADRSDLVARVRLRERKTPVQADPLLEQIGKRLTNRRPGTRQSLSPVHAQVMTAAATQAGARLQLCQDREKINELARLLAEADRLRWFSQAMHAEHYASLRWTASEAARTRDGLDARTLELDAGARATQKILRSYDVVRHMRDSNGGGVIAMPAMTLVPTSAAIGFLTIDGTEPHAYVTGGRAMQQVWLTAGALGLAVHPWNTIVELFTRVERHNGQGLDRREVGAVSDLREAFTRCFSVSLTGVELLLFRLSHAEAPAQRSLRRPIDELLTTEE